MSNPLCLPAEYNTRRRYAILLLHEGAPFSLNYWSVACFLAVHLRSRRRVDLLPRWIWYPILYLLVLPWRTFYETRSYVPFWIPMSHSRIYPPPLPACGTARSPSSPGHAVCVYHLLILVQYLQKLVADLIPRLLPHLPPGEVSVQVEVAFSSQPHSLDAALERFRLLGNYTGVRDSQQGRACVEEEHLVVLPLYPQYSSVHTAVAFDALTNAGFFTAHRTVPHLHFLRSYATRPAYLHALTAAIARFHATHGPPDWLFVVFEGLSRRFVTSGDCYQVECHRTFTALRAALANPSTAGGEGEEGNHGIAANRMTISFLDWGVEPCLEPSTRHVVAGIASQMRRIGLGLTDAKDGAEKEGEGEGWKKALGTAYFVCPGIAVDDNRSLQLVQKELCELCLELGWQRAEYIPALNESREHVKMLASIISEYVR
uniref:Ferrochelatase n=1 Tax=Phytomonas sp. JMPA-2011 TaxID=1075776 RepID=G1C9R1_9TRYP|nr:ferrochelatase [Phytomonas sp. JMPA-2011]